MLRISASRFAAHTSRIRAMRRPTNILCVCVSCSGCWIYCEWWQACRWNDERDGCVRVGFSSSKGSATHVILGITQSVKHHFDLRNICICQNMVRVRSNKQPKKEPTQPEGRSRTGKYLDSAWGVIPIQTTGTLWGQGRRAMKNPHGPHPQDMKGVAPSR